MKVDIYFKPLDMFSLGEMLVKRNMDPALVITLPQAGFVVKAGEKKIAYAFLRKCEGDIFMVEGYITDPDCEACDRNSALDLLTTTIDEYAAKTNSKLICFTSQDSIISRAVSRGYKISSNIILFKD
jgi:hypothetical protein